MTYKPAKRIEKKQTLTENPMIPKDIGVKIGSPAMTFWQAVIDTTKQQLEIAADSTTYHSAVLKMAEEHYQKAEELYTRIANK